MSIGGSSGNRGNYPDVTALSSVFVAAVSRTLTLVEIVVPVMSAA